MNDKDLPSLPISPLFPVYDSVLVQNSANIQLNPANNQLMKCSTCNRCLQELFRQGCYLMFGDLKNQSPVNFSRLPNNINEGRLLEKLCLPDHPQIGTDGFCRVCDTRVIQLKIEAARAIRNLKRQNHLSQIQTSHWQTLLNRQLECHSQGRTGNTPNSNWTNRLQLFDRAPPNNLQPSRYPFEIISCLQSKTNPYRININNNRYHPVDYSKPFHWAIRNNLASTEQINMINNNKSKEKSNSGNSILPKEGAKEENEPSAIPPKEITTTQSNLAAAASFFAKAGKKTIACGTESTSSFKRKKKMDHAKLKESDFSTCFSEILKSSPPPVPPTLLKTSPNRPLGYNAGKIKVILRLKYLETSKPDNYQNISPSQTCISVDSTKKQITVFESLSSTSTPRKINANIPKIYAFDAVYTDDDDPTELCSNALTDIIQAVVSGIDGCVFSFGHLRASSNVTMIGSDQNIRKLGLIPCAISWLFRLICEQKEKTGARFSVRVSAIEVHGKQEVLKDLLSDIEVMENVGQCSPGVYLRDDPVSGTQLQNQSELRAPTAEKAAYYLDAALAARTMSFNEEDSRLSHFLFTLHVYQYRVERGSTGSAVAGGRSRLYMLDFGSGRISTPTDPNHNDSPQSDLLKPECQFNSTALSLSATAAVLLALVNGQRHIPYRTSKLSQLLREAMSSLSCKTCMVAHIAMNTTHCTESMQIIQFASKMQRLKRRKFSKLSGTSSDDSSSCDSFAFRRASRHSGGNTGFSSGSSTNGMTSSEADYTSSSEQSCDTVIYLGASRNKIGEEQSSFLLRKRRISAPSFTNPILEKSGSESDLLKLDISKYHLSSHHFPKASVRTNALVWPKVAAKNAIETLSTQKEMWVDGPMVSDKSKKIPSDTCATPSKILNKIKESQTHSKDHGGMYNDSNSKNNHSSNIERISDTQDTTSINNESLNINTISITSTNSTFNDNPSSQESTTAVVGSSDSDQRLIEISNSPFPDNYELPGSNTVHSVTSVTSHLPIIVSQSASAAHPIVTPQAYKPFVWDWVEKHSDMIVDGPITNKGDSYPFQVYSIDDVQSPQKRSAKHCAKHQQLLKKSKQSTTNEQPLETNEREGRKRHKSAKHKNVQVTMTHENYKITQFNNPSVEPNYTRVAEWVRSVSEETNRAQSLSPIRRNNTVKESKSHLISKDHIHLNNISQNSNNYRSLDRHAQGFITTTQPVKHHGNYPDTTDIYTSSSRFPCISAGSRTFDSIPLPSNQFYSQDLVNIKKGHILTKFDLENQPINSIKKVNSQNEEIFQSATNQQRNINISTKQSIHSSSRSNSKNSPTKQVVERQSPNKTRSSSLIKNALFGRCKLSSSSTIDDNNQYSVPNSPCKNRSSKNSSKQSIDFVPVSNTGGYHYVVMTSSLNSPIKHLQDETSKSAKRRSSSTSPGKSSDSSTSKIQLANANRREKLKEKNKESKVDNKIKIKKESKKKLSFLTSPLFGKKKEKEKSLISNISKSTKQMKNNPPTQICSIHHGQHENPSKVISPYYTVTQPKHSAHSSSGHGSDCSSIYGPQHKFSELAGHIKCRECTNIDEEGSCLNHIDQCNIDQHQLLRRSQRRGGGHTSSGYESIMRDSEVSSQNDSTSESSLGAAPRPLTPEKQQSQSSSSSSKQSRSAPNRSEETSEDTQSPVSVRKMSPKAQQKNQISDQQKKDNEIKKIAKQIQFEKIYDLLAQQDMLKTELLQSKERILVDPTSWSYDLHVVEQMDPEDSSFIEALEKETDILRRRVEACKSHVLLITYFDIKYRHPMLSESKAHLTKVETNRKSGSTGITQECYPSDSQKQLKL